MFRVRKLIEQFSYKPTSSTTPIKSRNLTNDAIDSSIVIRKEIRSMSSDEQIRFFNAIDTMLATKNDISGTSEFYRCASYHGLPHPIYCQHGRETFPGWHRIYLKDFESSLQSADILNGNDGKIGLPYWDWTKNINDGLPQIIRQRFNKWPIDLFPDNVKQEYPQQTNQLKRASDEQIIEQLQSFQVVQQAKDCLLATQHWQHASTEFNGPYPSLETPHNSIHVIVGGRGGAMSSVAWFVFLFFVFCFLLRFLLKENIVVLTVKGLLMMLYFGYIIVMLIEYMKDI